jgi:hypothetical protein
MKNLNAKLKRRKAEEAAKSAATPAAASTASLAGTVATGANSSPKQPLVTQPKSPVKQPVDPSRSAPRKRRGKSPSIEAADGLACDETSRAVSKRKADTLKKDTDEIAEVASQAASEIKAAIHKEGGAIKVCPNDWSTKYKATLGGYKKFLIKRKDDFFVTDTEDKSFIVTLAGNKPSNEVVHGMRVRNWRRGLHRAWRTYCEVTPGAEQNLDAFFKTLRDDLAARKLDSGTGVSAVADSSTASSKPSPVTAPKQMKRLKKKKIKKKISETAVAGG